jgi:hypothetical protein
MVLIIARHGDHIIKRHCFPFHHSLLAIERKAHKANCTLLFAESNRVSAASMTSTRKSCPVVSTVEKRAAVSLPPPVAPLISDV